MMTQNEQVLDYLRRYPGSTAHEVENGCRPIVSNPRARMSDLRKLGYRIEKVKRGGRKTGFVVIDPEPVQIAFFFDVAS
jgi:hypothetical protein